MYCGAKDIPRGKRRGTPNQCFKQGLRSGFAAGKSTSKADVEKMSLRELVQMISKLNKNGAKIKGVGRLKKPEAKKAVLDNLKFQRKKE